MLNVRFVESIFVLAIAPAATELTAQDIGSADQEQLRQLISKRPYSPYAGRSFATRVFWGDTHLSAPSAKTRCRRRSSPCRATALTARQPLERPHVPDHRVVLG
jgi:hypothetical protein